MTDPRAGGKGLSEVRPRRGDIAATISLPPSVPLPAPEPVPGS